MHPHRIRLAGPWEWRRITADAEKTEKALLTRCALPFVFVTDERSGTAAVMLLRRFHRPTGIDDRTKVFIVLEFSATKGAACPESLEPMMTASLNNHRLPVVYYPIPSEARTEPRSDAMRLILDASGQLKSFNDLQVVLPTDGRFLASLDSASLEIHEPA